MPSDISENTFSSVVQENRETFAYPDDVINVAIALAIRAILSQEEYFPVTQANIVQLFKVAQKDIPDGYTLEFMTNLVQMLIVWTTATCGAND